ncbi:hypothetical protein AXG93_1130s1000 [Marchantia polymorpha subsp. ruderalis]|uniref:Uncharacterized protein n=1 Tax=Marchantia polymorpha subsp. ruderalis TaxID=1480154 RepID=A0A176VGY4_MARPO|nr:hypothetical protein AXG93_1130s1000 [Marchantia polymorpha subsp. ruderalis]
MTAPIKMQSPDFWARAKMKAMRLITEEYRSMESRSVAARGRSTQEAGPVTIIDKGKEVPVWKKPRTTKEQLTPVKPRRALKTDKRKAVLTEEVPPKQDETLAFLRGNLSRRYLGPRPITYYLHIGPDRVGVCILLPLPVEVEFRGDAIFCDPHSVASTSSTAFAATSSNATGSSSVSDDGWRRVRPLLTLSH